MADSNNKSNKKIILCADDFAQHPGISQGILQLIKAKRLSATSCLTTSPHWQTDGQQLQPYAEQIDIGLHFNLTEGRSICGKIHQATNPQLPGLSQLISASLRNKLNVQHLIEEIEAQLDQFVTGLDRLPDFIDGHQHIHHLPVIQDALLKVYQQRLAGSSCYIRSVHPVCLPRIARIKAMTITTLGAISFKDKLVKYKIPHNSGFAGIYNFSSRKPYSKLCRQWLAALPDDGLLMCHPGQPYPGVTDSIANIRQQEYQYLSSQSFIEDCQRYQVTLYRLSH
jgi:predicted glycoside hydrolase/deacetylase ChbG (UPF0249 family)